MRLSIFKIISVTNIYSSKLNEVINKNSPDLIHTHAPNYYILLTLTVSKKYLVVATLWGSDVMKVVNASRSIKNYIFRLYNEFAYRRSLLISPSSVRVIDKLIEQFGFFAQKEEKACEQY
ncbi:glycosyltransferase [Marinomonas sp. 5E14-1]|uniref:glycosyltransferase n=1 Tax=Marinomonas sp. 5E14-1 TaxID=3153922 RepID=UPI00326797B1